MRLGSVVLHIDQLVQRTSVPSVCAATLLAPRRQQRTSHPGTSLYRPLSF